MAKGGEVPDERAQTIADIERALVTAEQAVDTQVADIAKRVQQLRDVVARGRTLLALISNGD